MQHYASWVSRNWIALLDVRPTQQLVSKWWWRLEHSHSACTTQRGTVHRAAGSSQEMGIIGPGEQRTKGPNQHLALERQIVHSAEVAFGNVHGYCKVLQSSQLAVVRKYLISCQQSSL